MKRTGKKIIGFILIVALLATTLGDVHAQAKAKSKGYAFKYKGVTVYMHKSAKKLKKKAGKVKSKKESKSCVYEGYDRVYKYKNFILATYSKSEKGTEYVNGIKFRTKKVSTKEGIHLGSSLNDVFDAYGEKSGYLGVYTYTKGKSKLQFEVKDDVVTAIQYVAK